MYIGLDVGGTKIRGGLVDVDCKVIKVIERPTEAKKGKKVVIENIFSILNQLDTKKVKGIGVAVRGFVDHDKGIVRKTTMMPGDFKRVKLAEIVRCKYKKPVKIENDTNCFALAEAKLGAGRGKANVVGITFGTGIGGGLILNGELYRGFLGGAGEIGHMTMEAHSYKWNCGQKGCFESLCSGTAQSKIYKELTGKVLSGREVGEAYHTQDRKAVATYKQMAHNLSIALANIIHFLDPDIIVIGGGFSEVRFYFDSAIKNIDNFLVYKDIYKTKIKYAKLGKKAELVGATLLFR